MINRAILILFAISVCLVFNRCEDTAHEGKYINANNPTDQLELKPHGGFSLNEKGHTTTGKYELEEGKLTLITAAGKTTMGELRGDTLTDENNGMWILWRAGTSDRTSAGSSQNDRVRHSSRESITLDIESLGADAYQYKLRPSAIGGGGGSYEGYAIDAAGQWGNANSNAAYSIKEQTPTQLVLIGTSKMIDGASVTITFDGDGKNIGTSASGW